jgi:SAM-dependent methyltransferase
MAGREIDLLKALPRTKRDVNARSAGKSAEVIAASKEFGELYFDGPREYGYGGYRYDGRWIPVARDIIAHFDLKPGDKVLDIGCGKGFLVKDLVDAGIDAYGLDVSDYGVKNCPPDVVGRLHRGDCRDLPFPDASFAAVLCINTLQNLTRDQIIIAVREIERLAPGRAFIQVDSYRTEADKAWFENWVLTAEFHDYPEGWVAVYDEAGYTGDYYWMLHT